MPDPGQDVFFMRLALELAKQAAEAGEVPVGALVVQNGHVIGRGRNSPIRSADPTAHAEMQAIRDAAHTLGNYRLEACTLYVTLEPCAMCCGAILHARLDRVVFGASDRKTGCAGSVTNLFDYQALNHQTKLEGGLLQVEAVAALQQFFSHRRGIQRAQAVPLREDALRTPDACFDGLMDYPWPSHYISDLPVLAGLRMHFLDEGPRDASDVLLCLHPVPGWTYSCRHTITQWLAQGKRVIAPDLIGFGKSDKPKRADFHSAKFHVASILQLLDSLDIDQAALASANASWGIRVFDLANGRFVDHITMQLPAGDGDVARNLPFPDAGHRAAERAFASRTFC